MVVVRVVLCVSIVRRRGAAELDIMGAQIQCTKCLERDLRVESKALEADGSDVVSVLVEGVDSLKSTSVSSGLRETFETGYSSPA